MLYCGTDMVSLLSVQRCTCPRLQCGYLLISFLGEVLIAHACLYYLLFVLSLSLLSPLYLLFVTSLHYHQSYPPLLSPPVNPVCPQYWAQVGNLKGLVIVTRERKEGLPNH